MANPVTPIQWSAVEPEFRDSHGQLFDISVLGTDLMVWQMFLDHCRTLRSAVTFTVDRTTAPFPQTAKDAFGHREADRVAMLSISLDGLVLNTHFFGEEAIDMDMDPRELTPERFERLCDWIITVGRMLDRSIELQHEGGGIPVLRFDANDSSLIHVLM